MKKIIHFLVFCLVATCNAELRTWTAVNGKEVDAEFVSNEKGIVTLKLKSGKLFIVPLNKLSKSDQEFLKPKPSSGPLVDNIVGKVMTFEFEGDKIMVQFNGDGRMLAGENGGLEDGGETYKIEGNEVLVFSKGNRDGGISFTSSSPKVGDQVELGPKGGKIRSKIIKITNVAQSNTVINIDEADQLWKLAEDISNENAVSKEYTGWQKRKYDGKIIILECELYLGEVRGLQEWKNGKVDGRCSFWYDVEGELKVMEETINKNGEIVESKTWHVNGKIFKEQKKNDDGVLETILWHKNGKKAALGVIDPKLQGMKGKYWNSKGEPVKSLKEAFKQ